MGLLRVKRKETDRKTRRVSANVSQENRKTARVSTTVKQPAETYEYKREQGETNEVLGGAAKTETTSTNSKKSGDQPTEQELFDKQMNEENETTEAPKPEADPEGENKTPGSEAKPFLKKYGLWLVAAVVVFYLILKK